MPPQREEGGLNVSDGRVFLRAPRGRGQPDVTRSLITLKRALSPRGLLAQGMETAQRALEVEREAEIQQLIDEGAKDLANLDQIMKENPGLRGASPATQAFGEGALGKAHATQRRIATLETIMGDDGKLPSPEVLAGELASAQSAHMDGAQHSTHYSNAANAVWSEFRIGLMAEAHTQAWDSAARLADQAVGNQLYADLETADITGDFSRITNNMENLTATGELVWATNEDMQAGVVDNVEAFLNDAVNDTDHAEHGDEIVNQLLDTRSFSPLNVKRLNAIKVKAAAHMFNEEPLRGARAKAKADELKDKLEQEYMVALYDIPEGDRIDIPDIEKYIKGGVSYTEINKMNKARAEHETPIVTEADLAGVRRVMFEMSRSTPVWSVLGPMVQSGELGGKAAIVMADYHKSLWAKDAPRTDSSFADLKAMNALQASKDGVNPKTMTQDAKDVAEPGDMILMENMEMNAVDALTAYIATEEGAAEWAKQPQRGDIAKRHVEETWDAHRERKAAAEAAEKPSDATKVGSSIETKKARIAELDALMVTAQEAQRGLGVPPEQLSVLTPPAPHTEKRAGVPAQEAARKAALDNYLQRRRYESEKRRIGVRMRRLIDERNAIHDSIIEAENRAMTPDSPLYGGVSHGDYIQSLPRDPNKPTP